MDSANNSILSRQPSGIRALPSHDDDDTDEIYDDFDANPDYEFNNSNEIDLNLNYNGYDNISSSMSSGSVSSGGNGGLVSGYEDFETGFLAKGGVPVAKVSGEVDDEDEEEIELEEEEEERVVVVPRVRVVGEEDGEDEWSETLEVLNVDEEERYLGVVEKGNVVEGVNETVNVDESVNEMDNADKGVNETNNVNKGVEEERYVGVVEKGNVDEGVNETDNVDNEMPNVDGGVEEERNEGALEAPIVDKGVNEMDNVDKGVNEISNVDKGVEETPIVDKGVDGTPIVDEGVEEEQKVESLEALNVDKGVAEERDVESVKVGGELEGDAIVDSINVDVVEVIRSGVAVVGVDDKTENGAGSVEEDSSVVGSDDVDVVESRNVVGKDKEEIKNSGVDVVDSNEVVSPKVVSEDNERVKDSAVVEAAGVKLTDEGDAIVDSIKVDVAEAVRSGTAIVGEVGEAKESGSSAVEDSVVENIVPECPKAVVSDEVDFVYESDSVVDGIKIDVVEAVRSGVAVVGEPKLEGSELEQKEIVAPVSENVAVANNFAPLADEAVGMPSDKQIEQINEAEAPQPVSIKKNEPDAPDASSVLVEAGKASNRSYADVLVNGIDINSKNVEQTKTATENEVKAVQQENGDDKEDAPVYFGGRSSSRQVTENGDDHSEMIDGQVVTESDEGDSEEEGEGNKLPDSAKSDALMKAATADAARRFFMERPAGLEPAVRSVRPIIGSNNSSFFRPPSVVTPSDDNLSEVDKKKMQNLQHLKVKLLRLVQRLGFTAEHSLAAQIIYKLTVFAGRPVSPAFNLDSAKQTAMQLETEGKDDLDFSLNILVLGKTGVGKSAIINSIFGEEKVKINAFEPETTVVNEVCGTVEGVKVRFIDAPGLKLSAADQGFNRKVLASVKKFTTKCPPDVVFYVDRLDSKTRDLNDLPLLKTISKSLGASVWGNAIIILTHAASAPPDGPSGSPLSYDVFVAQRSHIVQQLVGQAIGDMRLMNLNMNPVSLVENHPACRKNRDGEKILPNGQIWRPQLLLLCYSVKILSEATAAASKSQATIDPRKIFSFRTRTPPLPYFLSSMLQSRTHPKLTADQGGDNVDSDIDLDDVSDSDQEEEDEYDQLPPFKPLKKSQLAKLSGEQQKAYFEEYDYRVKLLQRKQWREELKRIREMKNGKNGVDAYGETPEEYDGENLAPAAVQVPLPDMTLPPSFDSDNPAYRYRFLEPTSQFMARPVLDPQGWDHDCGYDGVNIEQHMGIAGRFPASYTVQLTKDKTDFNVHLDSALSAKHGENGSSLVGFDVQTIGKQYAYIVRGETKFKNMKKNKTAAGVTVTFLGENVATGVKVEDQIMLGKRLVLVGSTGTVRSQKDAAYGANMEVRLREADYPIGQEQSSFTLSLMKWRGDLAIGGNLQSQVSVGRNSKVAVRAALNNKMSGQITVRTSSSDHLSLALAGLMPIVIAIYQKIRPGVESENYSIY